MKKKKKQVWVYESLIERAKKLTSLIHTKQEKGELYEYPLCLSSSELINMALAVGLKEIEEKVGEIEEDYRKEEKEEEMQKVKSEDSEFVKKLLGGL